MRIQRFFLAWLICLALTACAASGPQAGPVDVRAPAPAAPPPPPGAKAPAPVVEVPLPNRTGSLKFAVLGDFGDGSRRQYDTAAQMATTRGSFPFEIVVTVGDNMYGNQRERDYETKFAIPYKPLLDAGVKFYAALGNHDDVNQRLYKHFNMDAKRYYSFKAPKQDVRFFAIESSYPTPEQMQWVEAELKGSGEAWKIAYLHHPLYSSGGRHGSETAIRDVLEPLFLKYNVSVVFAGHDHFYERIKAQKGIAHFVVGSGGKLRAGDIDRGSGLTARGFDTDNAFLVAEIDGDEMVFNAISRAGRIVDSGTITRRKPE